MIIKVLVDNHAGARFKAEHGLSYLVETDKTEILFDTGPSDLYLTNAQHLGLNIKEDIDSIVLSHGHWDHGNGLEYLTNKSLIAHPVCFKKRYRKTDGTPVGLSLSFNKAAENFNLQLSREPQHITNKLVFLGEIPRITDFESHTTPFIFENGEDDFVMDDTALAAIIGDKLVIITGCSHSGICNICEQARKVTGVSEIEAVIGGFHLKQRNVQMEKTIRYLKQNKIAKLYPSHCTELPAISYFLEEFNCVQVKTGMIIEF